MSVDFKRDAAHLVLMVALLLLIVTAVFRFISLGSFRSAMEATRTPDIKEIKGKELPTWSESLYVKKLANLTVEQTWPSSSHRMFYPFTMVYSTEHKRLVALEPGKVEYEGIMVIWYDKHGIRRVPGVNRLDPDKDLFTTKEEYDWEKKWGEEMDPNNPNIHPLWVTKLKYIRYNKQDFQILFPSYTPLGNGDFSFQITRIDKNGRKKTEFLKKGEETQGEDGNYTVQDFVQNIVKKRNDKLDIIEDVDESELTLKREDGLIVKLKVGNKEVSSLISADLVFPLANPEEQGKFKVEVGQIIQLRGEKYKVLDITKDVIRLKQVSGDKEFTIQITAN